MTPTSVADAWTALRVDLFRFIRRRVDRAEDAEDLLHEVFLRAQDRVSQLRDPARVDAWLYRIARNVVVDRHRGHRESLEQEVASSDEEPDLGMQALEMFALQVVDELDEPYRSAIRWTTIEGLTQREAAERAGISVSGMKSRVQRARTMLRGRIDECCAVELDVRKHPVGVSPKGQCAC